VILTKVYPAGALSVDLDSSGGRDQLLELYRPPTASWLRLNLIASVDGNAAGIDGTSESLTNAADRIILGVIRELSDVVVVGANSVRREGYFLPRRSRLAVVTISGDLSGHRINPAADLLPLIVVCPLEAVARVRETLGAEPVEIVCVAPSPETNLLAMADIVAALRSMGLNSIVCEGGPQLIGQLLAARLVDEACFSTSPILGGSALGMANVPVATEQALELHQLIVDETSGIYARWLIRPVA
jgi:riboflavin biosynthesis pyrimidine reductase